MSQYCCWYSGGGCVTMHAHGLLLSCGHCICHAQAKPTEMHGALLLEFFFCLQEQHVVIRRVISYMTLANLFLCDTVMVMAMMPFGDELWYQFRYLTSASQPSYLLSATLLPGRSIW